MPKATLPPNRETTNLVTIDTQPIHIPQGHTEDLGPISDTSPDTWQYHPEIIEQYYRQRLPQVLGRLIGVFFVFFRLAFGLWWDKISGKNPQEERKRAIQLREMLTELGQLTLR